MRVHRNDSRRRRSRSRIGITAALLVPTLFAVGCAHGETRRVKLVEPPPAMEPAPTTAPDTPAEVEPSAAAAREIRRKAEAPPAASTGAKGGVEPSPSVALEVRGTLRSAPNGSSEPAPVPPEAKALPYTHTVRWKGETLWIVALWYTGAGSNWTALAKANPLLNPRRIKPGDKILIPAQLLRQRRPLPYERVHPSAPQRRAKSASPKQPSVPLPRTEAEGIRKTEPPPGSFDETGESRDKAQESSTSPDDVKLFGPRERGALPQ
jgi:LysM repeat protein